MIIFASKVWLFVIPLLIAGLVLLLGYARLARSKQIAQFAASNLLESLLQSYSPTRAKVKNSLIVLSLIFLCLALARPQWGYQWNEIKSKGIDVLFVLDASQSMLAEDIKPNRLQRAKFAILDFINKMEGDRIGLVAFAGNAFLQCPLTLDYDAFGQSLEAVDTAIISTGGTNISTAISEAEAAFSNDNNHKVMVMITDGEDLEEKGIKRAEKAARNGVKIYTVGVGTPNGGIIPIGKERGNTAYLRDDQGNIVRTKLDQTTLERIAQSTDAFYAPLGSTAEGLAQIYTYGLSAIPRQELASSMQRTEIDRFQWPLGIAILLLILELFISKRRTLLGTPASLPAAGNALALLASVFILAFASPVMAESGQSLFKKGRFEEATEAFQKELADDPTDPQVLYNLALTYYEQSDFTQAQSLWEQSLAQSVDLQQQQGTFHNLGNAFYRLGQTQLETLEYEDGFFENFPANTAAINEAIKLGQSVLGQPPQNRQPVWEQCEAVAEKAQTDLETAEKLKAGIDGLLEKWESSLEQYNNALALDPTHEDTLFNKDFVTTSHKDFTQRKTILDTATQPQKKLLENLKALIDVLKQPTQIVIDAQAMAEHLIEQGRYVPAHSILSQTAQQDPTAEVYQEKQQRLQQIVGILDGSQQEKPPAQGASPSMTP